MMMTEMRLGFLLGAAHEHASISRAWTSMYGSGPRNSKPLPERKDIRVEEKNGVFTVAVKEKRIIVYTAEKQWRVGGETKDDRELFYHLVSVIQGQG